MSMSIVHRVLLRLSAIVCSTNLLLQACAPLLGTAVQVPFDKPMLPTGNVEVWLAEVERRMKSSVRTQVGTLLSEGPKMHLQGRP